MTDTNRIMIALDFSTEEEVWQLLHRLEGEQLYVKVGMELFYSLGASFIYKLKVSGHQIFLDLKLHDIPNTVGKAMKAIAKLNVDMINVHASGGSAMLHRAMDGLESGTPM